MPTLPRRDFLKTSLAATVTAASSASALAAATAGAAEREFYELRCYHLTAGSRLPADADPALLHRYLEQAYLPALNRRGISPIGVFTELEVDKKAVTASPKADSPVWVFTPYRDLATFVSVAAELNTDATVQSAGAAYLDAPKSAPAFARIDSWLLRAFAGMPRLEQAEFSRERVPTRVFELRDYESHSELKALNKMAMFNDGEMQLMRELGMHPTFFGQALSGPNLPHLRYLTGGPDLATHLAAWGRFGPSAGWTALKNDPRYADNTSLNTARIVAPTSYSQI